MDIAMTIDQRTSMSSDEKSMLSPNAVSCDDVGDDILLDTYFDHSRPLDSDALDALLNTKFNTGFDNVDVEQPTDAITTQWRPAQSEALEQQQSSSRTRMEGSSLEENHCTLRPSQAHHPFNLSQVHSFGPSAHMAPTHHQQSQSGRVSPRSPYEPSVMMRQHVSRAQPFGQMPAHVGQGHYYSTPSPVSMPTMGDVCPGMHAQLQQLGNCSPSSGSRQSTADLMDYANTIPEQDETGESANSEPVDPCYAQLLYRCLRDVPDHTMALKDVYSWIRQYSQKARDSTNSGWQNSVRHNLSMNAAFERVTASTGNSTKKGSLWRLTKQALEDGCVISTTRFRKDPKRKPVRHSSPAIKRQISGAKGGQATRAASAHRRAMQARALGACNLNSLDRHRRNLCQQGPVCFTPTSMPNSNRATAAPQSGWTPHGMPNRLPHNNSLPASPYFVQSVETDPFAMGPPQSLSNPHTPPEIHTGFGGPLKPNPTTAFDSPLKGYLNEFELTFHDQEMGGLFGNHDDFDPNTPSLGTEMSFTADEMSPPMSRLSPSAEPNMRP